MSQISEGLLKPPNGKTSKKLPAPNKTSRTPPKAHPGIEYAINIATLDPKSNTEPSKHDEQFNVYHIDGDLENCHPNNLKTICANCQRIMQKQGVRWKQGDLRPDF
mgnify:CR=1 FL=1